MLSRSLPFHLVALAALVSSGCTHDFDGLSGPIDPSLGDGSTAGETAALDVLGNESAPPSETSGDAALDATLVDTTTTPDTTVAPDTTMASDTTVLDTFVPDTRDTSVLDTFVPDTRDAAITDTGVPCPEAGGVRFEGHCYFGLSGKQRWNEGRTACGATSPAAHLVTITSAAEEAIVEGIFPGVDKWIGFSRAPGSALSETSFQWITGEAVTYKKWASGEPNDSKKYCVQLRSSNDWSDEDCGSDQLVVCERE